MVLLTKANNGESIKVGLNDEIVLRLPENATTGYRWAVVRADGLVKQEVPEQSQPGPPDPNSLIGSGGLREFRFRAGTPGDGRLELKYWREWEGDSSVVERFAGDIKVS